MNSDQLNEVALAIYRRVQRNAGVPKSDADEMWRAMDASGRGKWRLVAQEAENAIAIVNAGPAKARIWRALRRFRSFSLI